MIHWWADATLLGILHLVVVAIVVPAVLLTKKEPVSALAWCLAVIGLPFVGPLLYWEFGYNYIYRTARTKRRRATDFAAANPPRAPGATRGAGEVSSKTFELARLAARANAFPLTDGNSVELFHDTRDAFEELLARVAEARSHVHAEFFIIRNDDVAQRFIGVLTEKARQGVQVRLLYDAWGCVFLRQATLRPLVEAGGQVRPFLPLSPLRSLFHFNLRNHRKICVIDGAVGFTGGMNIGAEYLGENEYFGYWRDSFARVTGPGVAGLQRVFAEDWDFAGGESLNGPEYFPEPEVVGDDPVQIVESGPDQEINAIRDVYLMAILAAQRRLWMASPYFIPDQSLMDALRLATYRGVDVRLLTILRPDHYLSYYAGRSFWADALEMGVRVHLYRRGMMHSKTLIVDDDWAIVGSANLDRRSLYLNFEIGCMVYSGRRVKELAWAYERDLEHSIELERQKFLARPMLIRVFENGCRLLAPSL